MENNNTQRISKAAAEYQRRKQKNKTMRTIAIVAAVVVVLAIVLASYFTSGTWYRNRTVMTVGDHKISCAEFNYFYSTNVNNTYQSLQQSYGEAASILLNLSVPLDEQEFSEGVTWKDRMKEMTVDTIRDVYALYDEASANGFMLTNDDLAVASLSTAGIEQAAKNYGLTTEQYLQAAYGKGVTPKLYADCIFKTSTASGYAQTMAAELNYTDDEIEAYYGEHVSDFDTINMRIFAISSGDDEGTRTIAEQTANDMLAQLTDEDSFAQLAYQYAADNDKDAFKDKDSTYHASVPSSSLNCDGMVEWFYDDARQYGDTNIFSDDSGYYVVMYIGRDNNDYFQRNMRHILASFVTDSDGNTTDESKEGTKALAEKFMEEWNDSDKTEDTFAEMAQKYSNDNGSKNNGGFIGNITKGSLVEPINTWIFDESREVGDVELMETEYGWHLVYYAGETDVNNRVELIDNAMREADNEAWYNSVTESCSVSVSDSVYNSKMVG